MNQKEAEANGLTFGSANAQKVLKKIRDHVVWNDELTSEERQLFDEALLLLDPLGRKYQAEWFARCREVAERNRVRWAGREAAASETSA